MNQIVPARCAQVSLNVRLPQFNCTNNTLGDFGNLSDFGRAIGSIPGQLGTIADCVTADVRRQIETSVDALRTTLNHIFGAINTTVSDPVLGDGVQVPEIEYEFRMSALWQEFKLYLQQKLFDILSKIPGLEFIVNLVNVPIPFLSGVRIFDVFTSEGRARIRAAVRGRVDAIAALMGEPDSLTFSGELGLQMPEVRTEHILRRIYTEIERVLTEAIGSAVRIIHTLTRPIREIWNRLGLPELPSFEFLNFDEFFQNIWTGIKDLAISQAEKLQRAMDAMLNFDIGDYLRTTFGSLLDRIKWPFPTRVRELLDGASRLVSEDGTTTGVLNRPWNLTMPEWDFSVVSRAVRNLFVRLPMLILELFLQLIRPFLQAIEGLLAGVAELLKFIPFTFCTFINLVASPLLGLGGVISGLLPEGIPVVAAPASS